MSTVLYNRVALIGLGLIASSMFWAMKRAGVAGEVTGYARSEATRDTARRIGLCDLVCDSAAEAVKDADLVVLCVPVGVMGQVAQDIAPMLKPGATVTDVGSVKASVVKALAPHIRPDCHLIPGHPVAGTEQSGPA
ncbi:MAG: prephenate dehydrogenase/arogenate dehydrogenase family protein, partial [Rhodobacteraceae bacterium]|nr:prephenate dehydrogenase/arogenate dehydrogenase family protein [Paracoccaceae bacterium]